MRIVKQGEKYLRLPTVTDTQILGFFGEYRFLSNFEVCLIQIDGRSFWSSEAAYMSMKSHDVEYKNALAAVGCTPAIAKAMGRNVVLRDDWDYYRVLAMYRAVYAKFVQNPGLLEKLFATGDKYLEETNNWGDRFWGVDDCEGLNMLGKTLMAVRSDLKGLV